LRGERGGNLIQIRFLVTLGMTMVFLLSLSPIYAQSPTLVPAAGLTQIEDTFGHLIEISVAGAFIALFVVLVWAGIKFLTSSGEPKALEAARNAVTWALLGILFMAIAWLILQLIAAFTGIDALKTFSVTGLCPGGNCIPSPTPVAVPTPTP